MHPYAEVTIRHRDGGLVLLSYTVVSRQRGQVCDHELGDQLVQKVENPRAQDSE